MKMRALTQEDMVVLDDLYEKYYSHQFYKTDFMKNFLGAFIITDDYDRIVMGGGVRPIAEAIIITDKEANPHLLGDALLEALRFSLFTCKEFNIELLHAFVKDKAYERHLRKHGFNPRGEALYIGV